MLSTWPKISTQSIIASIIIIDGLGDGAIVSTAAIILNLSNLDFFILPPPCSFFFLIFIYLFIYLFIYFWLCWVFGSCEGFL